MSSQPESTPPEVAETEVEATPSPGVSTSRFHGLSDKAKISIILAATVMAVTSLIWGVVSWRAVNDDMRFDGKDYDELAKFFAGIQSGTNHDTYLMTHVIDLHVQMQRITNDQGLKSLAVSMCVALIAVGFALFLLGADGTFALAAEDKSGPSVTLQGTAPGLLCFALAAIVMGIVVTTGADLKITPGQLPNPPLPLPRTVEDANAVFSLWRRTQPAPPATIPLPERSETVEAHAPPDASELHDIFNVEPEEE
ncbi:MAG: hypothetical protein GY715_11885 [Planctomycetes bacterium]|nr:hypothetical protein [Planctomycetota bacterium]